MAKELFKQRTMQSKQDKEGSKDSGVNKKGESREMAKTVNFSMTPEKRCSGSK